METKQTKVRLSSTYGEMQGESAKASIEDKSNKQMIFPIQGKPINTNNYVPPTNPVKTFMDNNPDFVSKMFAEHGITRENLEKTLENTLVIFGNLSTVLTKAWSNIVKIMKPLMPIYKKKYNKQQKYKKRVANRQKLYEKRRKLGRVN